MEDTHLPTPRFFIGVVRDNNDKDTLQGMCKVRIFGYHNTQADNKIPDEDLMWARVVCPTTSASLGGIGFSPTGLLNGTHVYGLFVDGDNCQAPLILGTLIGVPDERGGLWGDPNEEHPRILNESDVNRLARNENINKTIVKERNDNLIGSTVAFSDDRVVWKEQKSSYDAEYPFNFVYESVGGHVQEFDSTKGNERYHLWHPTGTYTEIDFEGSKHEKIKKDRRLILEGDDYILIEGDGTVTLKGDLKIRVDGDAQIEVRGDVKEKIHGNYELEVKGDYQLKIGGETNHITEGTHTIKGETIQLN